MMEMKLIGAKELERKLSLLPAKVAKNVVRKALRKGAKPIQQTVKANAKSMIGGEMGGLIAKAVSIRAAKKKQRGTYGLNVMLSAKYNDQFVSKAKTRTYTKGKNKGKAVQYYIPAAIEYGHGSNKKDAAIPFMRSAFESQKSQSVNVTLVEMKRGVEAVAKGPG